jgi:hypothetical protein
MMFLAAAYATVHLLLWEVAARVDAWRRKRKGRQ